MRFEDIDQATVVTVGEVHAAIVLVAVEMDLVDDADAQEFAQGVIMEILGTRERDWHIGDVVRDNNGVVWQRCGGSQWKRVGNTGMFGHKVPARPLTLLDSPQDRKDEKRRAASMERARDDGAPI